MPGSLIGTACRHAARHQQHFNPRVQHTIVEDGDSFCLAICKDHCVSGPQWLSASGGEPLAGSDESEELQAGCGLSIDKVAKPWDPTHPRSWTHGPTQRKWKKVRKSIPLVLVMHCFLVTNQVACVAKRARQALDVCTVHWAYDNPEALRGKVVLLEAGREEAELQAGGAG